MPMLLRIAFALLVLASSSAAATADGLGRFEAELKPKIEGLAYENAQALGPSGFSLTGVRMTVPADKNKPGDKPATLTAKRVVVEDLDFDNAGSGDGPHFLKLRIEGAETAGAAGDLIGQYGIAIGPSDLALDYRFEPERKVFTLNRLEIAMPGLARLELGLVLDGVSAADAADPARAKDEVSLRTGTLVYDDASLLAKLVAGYAASEKQPEGAALDGAKVLIAGLAQGQGQEAMAVLDALASYISDYRQPKSALRLSLHPGSGISSKDLDKLTVANAVVDVFGLTVSYAGTRPGAALAAQLSQPQAAKSGPGAGPANPGTLDCTPGTRLFVHSDGAWWSATIKEAASESRRCIVTLEGADSNDDRVVGSTDMLAWSGDGPGLAAASCKKGDEVWSKSEGGWYPAKVQATPKPGRPCTIRYENDDDAEDEQVELRRLRVIQ